MSFAVGSDRVDSRLERAAGQAVVSGNTASYAEVMPGVNERYSASSAGLKDELTLTGRAAPARFVYDLQLSRGLTPRLSHDSVAFVDSHSATRISFPAPFMYDATDRRAAAQRVPVGLARAGGSYRLTLSTGGTWVRSRLAAGHSIVVDPEAYPGSGGSCGLDEAAPTTSECAGTTDNVGWDGAKDHRMLLKFNVQTAVPRDVEVVGARVDLFLASATTTTAKQVGLYQVTRPWTTAATWNTSDGSTAWTSPGGDSAAAAADTQTIGASTGAARWYPQQLIQGWVDGTTPNNGMLLKDAQPGVINKLALNSTNASSSTPVMYVYYQPRLGAVKNYKLDSYRLTDRMSAGVNVANGNLVVKNHDLSIGGTKLGLVEDRFYNNLWREGTIGYGWGLSAGVDQQVYQNTDSPFVYYYGPTGEVKSFRKNADGTFTGPPELDAIMTQQSAGQITIKFRHNQTTETFQGKGPGSNLYLTSLKDQNNNQLTFSYDNIIQPDYNHAAKIQTITDTQGRQLTFTYGTNGFVSKVSDSTGRTWQYGRDANSDLTTYTDPSGGQAAFSYDARQNLTQITTPGGRITRFAYANEASGDNRVTSLTRVTDNSTGAGDTTRYSYESPTSPCQATDYAKTVVTDPNGHQTTYCLDAQDRPRVSYDAVGHQRGSTYDVDGNVLEFDSGATGTGAAISKATYDQNDSLISATDPANTQTTVGYQDPNAKYFPSKTTDGQGSVLNYKYDASQNLSSISPNADATPLYTFAYNPNGTVKTETDRAGNPTSYSYDAAGNLTKITPPAATTTGSGDKPLGPTSYAPDSLSRVASVTDGKGQATDYSYDPLDRVAKTTFADGATMTYSYDSDGNLTKRVDSAGSSSAGTGTEQWTYDQKGRITQVQLPGGQTSRYAFDAANNVTSMIDSSGMTSYAYDAINQLVSLAEPGGSCTSQPTTGCATFAYDANGSRNLTRLPNAVTVNQTSDAAGKPTHIQASNGGGQTLTRFDYAYLGDFIASMADKDGNSTLYSYDTRDRLTEARTTGPAAADDIYSYDINNNRATSTDKSGPQTFAYNSANQLCWKAAGSVASPQCASPPGGSTVYSYDANGNTTSASDGTAFAYNARNQTTAITQAGGPSTSQSYGGESQSELASSGSLTFENNLFGVGIQHGGQWGDANFVREPDGQLFSTLEAGRRHYYLFDGEGSVVGLANTSGGSGGYFTYDPYGRFLSAVGQNVANYWNYRGGLPVNSIAYHFGERYYHNATGRWTQQDPQSHPSEPQQYNPYVYVGDDPVNNADPTGMCIIFSCKTYHKAAGYAAAAGAAIGSTVIAGAGVVGTAACIDATEGLETPECLKIGGGALGVAGGGYATSYGLYKRARRTR